MMTRSTASREYVLRINLKSNADIRRYCEVHAKNDNVYVFQPRKGDQLVKISYHASGQRHLKIGNGPALFVRHEGQPEWIRAETDVFSQSFENFSNLLPYKGEQADDIFEIELPPPSSETLPYAEVSIGRSFGRKDWQHINVSAITIAQGIFPVAHSPSRLRVCVRLFQLQPIR